MSSTNSASEPLRKCSSTSVEATRPRENNHEARPPISRGITSVPSERKITFVEEHGVRECCSQRDRNVLPLRSSLTHSREAAQTTRTGRAPQYLARRAARETWTRSSSVWEEPAAWVPAVWHPRRDTGVPSLWPLYVPRSALVTFVHTGHTLGCQVLDASSPVVVFRDLHTSTE